MFNLEQLSQNTLTKTHHRIFKSSEEAITMLFDLIFDEVSTKYCHNHREACLDVLEEAILTKIRTSRSRQSYTATIDMKIRKGDLGE